MQVKKLIILTVLLFPVQMGISQIDSLRRAIAKAKNDSNKVLLLLSLGEQYEGNMPDSAISIYKRAGELSDKIHYPMGVIRYINAYTGILDEQGKFDESLQLSLQALHIAEAARIPRRYYGTLFNIGNNYIYRGDFDSAVKYYFQALPYFDKTNDSLVLGMIYNGLCNGYRGLKILDKAEAYSRLAVKYATDSSRLAAALNDLGQVLNLRRNYSEAQACYQKTYQIGSSLRDYNLMGAALINLGNVYNHLRENEKALKAYGEASDLFLKLDNVQGFAEAHKGLGYTYLLQNKMREALANYTTALDTARTYSLLDVEKDILTEMAYVEAFRRNTEASIRYDSMGGAISDSLFDKTVAGEIQELQAKYESDKKQSRIDQLEKDKQIQALSLRQKSTTITILVGSLAVLLVFLFLLNRIYRQRQQLHAQKLADAEKDKKLVTADAMLKGQEEERSRLAKDLHDGLGGMLTGVKLSFGNIKETLIMTGEHAASFERSLDMIDQSIGEMRRVAHNLMPEALLRQGLDGALRDYCNAVGRSGITKIIYQSIGLDKRIDSDKEIILYRIIQELVNNAVKHAGAEKVLLQVIREEERLHLTVEDNGKGFDPGQHYEGAGWSNIRSRVDYLKGVLDVQSGPGKGTWVNIEFSI